MEAWQAWVCLVLAGLAEVAWAFSLKFVHTTAGWYKAIPIVGTLLALTASGLLMTVAVKIIPLGTAYAVWVGIGTVGTASAGIAFFSESADLRRILALAVIVAGIVGLKLSTPDEPAAGGGGAASSVGGGGNYEMLSVAADGDGHDARI